MAVVVAIVLTVSAGCAPPRKTAGFALQYAIEPNCESLAEEIGNTVRVAERAGGVLIGTVRGVNCEASVIVVIDVLSRSGVDSTAVVALEDLSSVEVLSPSLLKADQGEGVGGAVLISSVVSLVLIIAVLTNLSVG